MNTASNNNIARAIYSLTKGKTHAEQSLIFPQVVQFLFRKRLLLKAENILSCLNEIINDDEGKIIVKVRSAEKINETAKRDLVRALSNRYRGKTIILEENLDEKLLGGMRLEINDEVIDLSIRNKIGKLQEYLTRPV